MSRQSRKFQRWSFLPIIVRKQQANGKLISKVSLPASLSINFQKKKIKNGKQTYMWVYRNRSLRGSHPIVLYNYLRVFLTDGNIPMDNNYAEQAIRPITIGRKSFVLIESSRRGAKANAILYSLVETAKTI